MTTAYGKLVYVIMKNFHINIDKLEQPMTHNSLTLEILKDANKISVYKFARRYSNKNFSILIKIVGQLYEFTSIDKFYELRITDDRCLKSFKNKDRSLFLLTEI